MHNGHYGQSNPHATQKCRIYSWLASPLVVIPNTPVGFPDDRDLRGFERRPRGVELIQNFLWLIEADAKDSDTLSHSDFIASLKRDEIQLLPLR